MGLFDRLEHALETLIEPRLLTSSPTSLHPLEIARALRKALHAQQRQSQGQRYVPNQWMVTVCNSELASLHIAMRECGVSLREVLLEEMEQCDFVLGGPLHLELQADETLLAGQFTLNGVFFDDTRTIEFQAAPSAGPTQQTTSLVATELDHQAEEQAHRSDESTHLSDFVPPPMASEAPQSPLASSVSASGKTTPPAWLHGLNGFAGDLNIPLGPGKVRTLGRIPDHDVHVPDPEVSKVHAYLGCSDTTWWITDTNSRNGLYLNGSRVPPGVRSHLHHGDTLTVGKSTFRYCTDPACNRHNSATPNMEQNLLPNPTI